MRLIKNIFTVISCSILIVAFFSISYNVIKVNKSEEEKNNEQLINNINDFIEDTIELNLYLDDKYYKN